MSESSEKWTPNRRRPRQADQGRRRGTTLGSVVVGSPFYAEYLNLEDSAGNTTVDLLHSQRTSRREARSDPLPWGSGAPSRRRPPGAVERGRSGAVAGGSRE
jgi:hypothetical protein